ncbi:hypothetical protein ACHAXT_013172 [Thalassiosira profunda]
MSLLLGRGAAGIGACARRGVLRASAVRPGGGPGPPIAPSAAAAPMPMIAMGGAAPAAIPLLMSAREFGKKKKKGDKREGLHKEVKHDAKAESRNKRRKKHASRMKQQELVERARYAELEAEGGGKPPFIGQCVGKGPDSWDCWEPTGLLRRWRIASANAALGKIAEHNFHLKKHMDRHPLEAGTGEDQLRDENCLTSMQYQSRLDWTAAMNDYQCVVSKSIIQRFVGESMRPTISDESYGIQMPMTPSTVKKVEKGQVVQFLVYSKRQLRTTPESCRFARFLCKRVAALEGDVVEFNGRKYTVPRDHFWALGDNPPRSTDSRHFGAVPLQNIRARIFYTFDPFGFKSVTK